MEIKQDCSFKKLVILGSAQSGKTSLRRALEQELFEINYIPTPDSKHQSQLHLIDIVSSRISCSLMKKPKANTYLNVFEVRLTETPIDRSLLRNLLFECQCAVFMIDLTSKASFDLVKDVITSLSPILDEKFSYLKIIIVGNKEDCAFKKVRDNDIYDLVSLSPEYIQLVSISLKEPKASLEHLFGLIHHYQDNKKEMIALSQVCLRTPFIGPNSDMKFFLLGDAAVGKTSFMKRHFNNQFLETHLDTIGIYNVTETVRLNRDNSVRRIQIWDTAGQERFRSSIPNFYKNADGIFLLFSFDNEKSFKNLSTWIDDLGKRLNIDQKSKEKKTILLLIGNKCDIENKAVSREEAKSKAKEWNLRYFEISCKYDINVDEVIAKMVLKSSHKMKGLSLNGSVHQKNNKNSCC